jgi:hypothetical protein
MLPAEMVRLVLVHLGKLSKLRPKFIALLLHSALVSVDLRGLGDSVSGQILEVAGRRRRLAELILPGAKKLPPGPTEELFWSRAASFLRAVDLSGCVKVTDRVVEALVENAGKRIEHLRLNGCSKISDRSLLAIGEMCPGLRTFDAGYCPRSVPWLFDHVRNLPTCNKAYPSACAARGQCLGYLITFGFSLVVTWRIPLRSCVPSRPLPWQITSVCVSKQPTMVDGALVWGLTDRPTKACVR